MYLITDAAYIEKVKIQEALTEKIKTKLSIYFKDSIYPSSIINEILAQSFIDSNPIFYLYYPYLFNKYFDFYETKTLDLISISGFLFYKSVIILDEVFDDKDSTNHFHKFFIANICQEEALKILFSFFDRNSAFWKIWDKRKLEYIKAFKLDSSLTSIDSYEEYIELADLKSTFGKIAIDCLYFLTDCKYNAVYDKLLKSHKYFYTSFQIIDDISDFQEDAINQQFNISAFELRRFLEQKNIAIKNYTIEHQKKIIYFNGIALELYSKAVKYLIKASAITFYVELKESLWVYEIYKLHNTCLTHFLNVKGFVIEYNRLNEPYKSFNYEKKENISNKGIQYIKNTQQEDGSWHDIFNDAGVSDVWVTAYTIASLSNTPLIDEIEIKKSLNFILEKRLKDGLWGYNKEWISDADSSSFALLSLKNIFLHNSDLLKESLNQWLNFQNEDGGFATYLNRNSLMSSLNSIYIKDVSGWLQSHFCVSAVAYLTFIELGITEINNFSQLREYLINKLIKTDKHLSYWWSNDIYAIHHILLAANKADDTEIIDLCKSLMPRLTADLDLNFYYKGLLLQTLCTSESLFIRFNQTVETLYKQITSNQLSNGFWKEGYSLLMPHPSVLDVNDNVQWIEGNKGTNIIVKDFNRIFTTVSCLIGVSAYEERL